jgi:mannose-1-phosphate guanylyltransferase
MDTRGSTWAVVLAGGSGQRLATLTTGADGVAVPKQFCHFGSPVTMLEGTLERARTIVPGQRIIAAVVDEHRRWWQEQLNALPTGNIVVQPRNQGTGAAVLQALVTIRSRDPQATLLVLPSDHGIEDEHVLRRTMFAMLDEARQSPEHLVLLGATPTSAETSYGWIVPNPGPFGRSSTVARFVEKPDASQARELLLAGALWNTFIFAGTAHALALLYSACRRRLRDEPPALDFSRHLLSAATDRLRVLVLPRCGWTDLGTPERMHRWMKRNVPEPTEANDARWSRSFTATAAEGGTR